MSPEELKQLQEVWNLIFKSGHVFKKGLELAREKDLLKASSDFCLFLETSIGKGRRGPMPYMNSDN